MRMIKSNILKHPVRIIKATTRNMRPIKWPTTKPACRTTSDCRQKHCRQGSGMLLLRTPGECFGSSHLFTWQTRLGHAAQAYMVEEFVIHNLVHHSILMGLSCKMTPTEARSDTQALAPLKGHAPATASNVLANPLNDIDLTRLTMF